MAHADERGYEPWSEWIPLRKLRARVFNLLVHSVAYYLSYYLVLFQSSRGLSSLFFHFLVSARSHLSWEGRVHGRVLECLYLRQAAAQVNNIMERLPLRSIAVSAADQKICRQQNHGSSTMLW